LIARGFELGEIEGEAAQQSEIFRTVIFAISALVLVHGDVENPMQA
jgi:hypothetical protein